MFDKVKIYIIDDIDIEDPLCKQINYNFLEGTVRHDIMYHYFTNIAQAFKSLETESAEFVFFTKPSNTFDPWHMLYMLKDDLDEYSLIGHVLDFKDHYYELHDQCFIISSKAYQNSGCKPFISIDRLNSLIKVDRSVENFHDDYTPIWVAAGRTYEKYKKVCCGALIISSLLENNYKIRPFNNEERKHKFYLYNDLALKYGSYLRIETNISDVIFNCATEPLIKTPLLEIEKIITPANGLQALAIIDKCPNLHTVEFKDISDCQLQFTIDLINNYNGINFADFCYSKNYNLNTSDKLSIIKYEEEFLKNLSTDFLTLKNRISQLKIHYNRESFFETEQLVNQIQSNCNTLYNFSNILSYRKTYHLYSQIHFNMMIKILAHHERKKGNNSIIRGILPSSETDHLGLCNTSVNQITLNPDPILNYEWRQDLYEYYSNYLKFLQHKKK